MQDTCNEVVTISPALAHLFEQHRRKEYLLIWYVQYVKTCRNREDAVTRIKEVFTVMLNDNIKSYPNDTVFVKAQHRRAKQTQQFIDDFNKLTHSDVDLLREMTTKEAWGTANGDTTKIVTINSKPFKVED